MISKTGNCAFLDNAQQVEVNMWRKTHQEGGCFPLRDGFCETTGSLAMRQSRAGLLPAYLTRLCPANPPRTSIKQLDPPPSLKLFGLLNKPRSPDEEPFGRWRGP